MCFTGMSRPLSSLWLLSLMMLSLIGATMLLMWILTSGVLSRTFDEVGRAVILDDLGEYAVLYERGGVAGVRATAGNSSPSFSRTTRCRYCLTTVC